MLKWAYIGKVCAKAQKQKNGYICPQDKGETIWTHTKSSLLNLWWKVRY